MNILYLSSEYPPETGYGGIGSYTRHIAEGMAQRNHRVTVLAASSDGQDTIRYSNHVTVYRIAPVPYPLPKGRYAYPFRKVITNLFPHTLRRICRALAVRKAVHNLCNRYPRFDIIESPECGAESLLLPRLSCKALIVRIHTPWEVVRKLDRLQEPFGDHYALPWIERHAAKRATQLSSPSMAMKNLIESRWNRTGIAVIPNPLPVHKYKQSTGAGWIYIGRIERRKGVHHLITAYQQLCSEYRTVPSLTLIGNAYGTDSIHGNYGTAIKNAIATAPCNANITWINHLDQESISRHLSLSSAAFFPSLWENYPYACLEAMASGCAVVASDCGGFQEIIEHTHSGLLVPPDSSDSIYAAMRSLITNPDFVEALGSAARKRVTTLASSEVICTTMEHFYHTTLKEQAWHRQQVHI